VGCQLVNALPAHLQMLLVLLRGPLLVVVLLL
jgi:hypothetical protein